MKRLVIVAIFSFFISMALSMAQADTITLKSKGFDRMAELKTIFQPGGTWYWNHWSEDALGDRRQITLSFNHRGAIRTTTISNKTCTPYSGVWENDETHNGDTYARKLGTCNKYRWGEGTTYQCCGFANMIFDLLWEMDRYQGYFMYYCPEADKEVSFLQIPGFDYRGCLLKNKKSGHYVIIMGFKNNTIYVTDCNQFRYCKIRWNGAYKTIKDVSVKGSWFVSPRPIILPDSLCDWKPYEVLPGTGLVIRSGASDGTRKIVSVASGSVVYVDAKRHYKNSENELWGYCKTLDGCYGWIRVGNEFTSELPESALLIGPDHLTIDPGAEVNLDEVFDSPGSLTATTVSDLSDSIAVIGGNVLCGLQSGYSQIEVSDTSGNVVQVAVTVLENPKNPVIEALDNISGAVVTADTDRSFHFDLSGLAESQIANAPVWHSSDDSVLEIVSVSDDGLNCVVRAISNGTAELVASADINMNNTYCNYTETWTASLSLAMTVPESGTVFCNMPEGSETDKLDYLRSVFLDGWYFDSWQAADLEPGEIQYTVKVSTGEGTKSVGVSNRPCDHNHCSKFWGYMKGVKSLGYARMLFNLISGKDLDKNGFMYVYEPTLDNLDYLTIAQPGDVLRIGSRYMVIISKEGGIFTVTECNVDDQCGIVWDSVFTINELSQMIRNAQKGRLYTPYARQIPSGERTRYRIINQNGTNLYPQPFNDSTVIDVLPQDSYFLADSTHVFVQKDSDYGIGTWALCNTESGAIGWILISDNTACVPDEDTEALSFYSPVCLVDDWCDLGPVQYNMREGYMDSLMSGTVSGNITALEVNILQANPLTGEAICRAASWGMSYDGASERITLLLEEEARFTDSEINNLTTGAYQWQVLISYLDGTEEKLWSKESLFWLIDENVVIPDQLNADIDTWTGSIAPVIHVDLRDADMLVNMLYYHIDVLSGEEVGEVACEFQAPGDSLDLIINRKDSGTFRFSLTVMGVCFEPITKTFSIVFLPCEHKNIYYYHEAPCTEEGDWWTICEDCGEIIADGFEIMDRHYPEVDSCSPAVDSKDGMTGEAYCHDCHMLLTDELIVPFTRTLFLPAALRIIESEAFAGINAVQVTIPSGVTQIGDLAFADCSQLLVVVIPDSVQMISDTAFSGCAPVLFCSQSNTTVIEYAAEHRLPCVNVH